MLMNGKNVTPENINDANVKAIVRSAHKTASNI
jgi:hypothetical protein